MCFAGIRNALTVAGMPVGEEISLEYCATADVVRERIMPVAPSAIHAIRTAARRVAAEVMAAQQHRRTTNALTGRK